MKIKERIGYGRLYEQMYSWMLDQASTGAAEPPPLDRFNELIEKAHDARYSDEWIGNVFRAIVGRGLAARLRAEQEGEGR